MGRALINLPARAKKGDIIEIKALVAHPMETGYRRETDGTVIPRKIIRHFSCRFNEEPIFEAEFFPAIAANPFLSFTTIAQETGTLTFSWTDDSGETQIETAKIEIE